MRLGKGRPRLSRSAWKGFKTAKTYAKAQFLIDLQNKQQKIRLFHAGNHRVSVKIVTTVPPNEVALEYPGLGKSWEWPITLGSVSAGTFKPLTAQTAIEHDSQLCSVSSTHQINVVSEIDPGLYRGEKIEEPGEFIFDC